MEAYREIPDPEEDETLESYEGFAEVYDTFMDNVPYDRWEERILRMLAAYGIREDLPEKNIVVDLGCGTGKMTERLADRGFDMIGIDRSEAMLSVAAEHEAEHPRGILYIQQDMTDFELYGCAGAVVSVCDSVNYLLSEEEMDAMLQRVRAALLPGGLFIFDFNTLHKYRDVIGNTTIAENRRDCSFIWENTWHDMCRMEIPKEEPCGGDTEEDAEDPDETQETEWITAEYPHINDYAVTFFVRGADDHGLFHRFREEHYQRGWEPAEIRQLLEKNGFEIAACVDDETDKAPDAEAQRIVVTARKPADSDADSRD